MPGSDGLQILGDFWKKSSELRFEASWFLDLGEANPVMDYGMSARCWVKWNSQQSKNCVCLSSCWKPKSQEGNKSFVPELKKVVSVSSVFSDSYACERFTYIRIFYIFVFGYVIIPIRLI